MTHTTSELLESAKGCLAASRPVPFAYDHSAGQFSFGEERIAPRDIPEWGAPYARQHEKPSNDEIDAMLSSIPMAYTYRAPASLPLFHEFIRGKWSDDLSQETVDVMADVMHATLPEGLLGRAVERKSFSARLIDRELGRVVLRVSGDCACLGPDATTSWGSKFWDVGIMDYTYHNTDIPAQRVALMAGLGHLAFRAQAPIR